MERAIKALNGISYVQWLRLKCIIDKRFNEVQNNTTLEVDEDILEQIDRIYKPV